MSRCNDLHELLEELYEPLCDIVFIVNNELRRIDGLSETGIDMIVEAVDKIEDIARTDPWMIEKKREEDE